MLKGSMMNKNILKDIVLEERKTLNGFDSGVDRALLESIKRYTRLPHVVVVSGIRRAGKSTLLTQVMREYYKDSAYYFNFEDERLLGFEAGDFNNLYEILVETQGQKKVFFFDEIQNIPQWELFVRRMQDKGFKFFITGSNASLLSKELGNRLTGRNVLLELYPFSFREYLSFEKYDFKPQALFDTEERAKIKRHFNNYLRHGGMPEYLKYKDASLLKRVYEDILYRDIVARHEIKEIKALRELGFYFLSNLATLFSYNNLKKVLHLGSVNTVRSFTHYLEDSYLILTLSRFCYSLKQQFVSQRKIYAIDNGLAEAVGFRFSANKGKFLENLVFLELKRRYSEFYYYKTAGDCEVDFLIRNKNKNMMLIQVAENISNSKTREREVKALIEAMIELKLNESFLLTYDEEEKIVEKNKIINVRPIYKWLLE